MEILKDIMLDEKDRDKKVLLEIKYAFNLLGSWERDLKTNELFWTDGTFNLRAAPVASVNLPPFQHTLQLVHEEDRKSVVKNFEDLHQQKEVSFEYRKVNPKGETRFIKVWSQIVNDDNGEPHLLRVTSQDVTTERALSNSLEEKNKELEKSNNNLASFSYVASHDLQEPLRKIQTFSHRIQETEFAVLSDHGKNYFNRMEQAALRMQNLIEDLLTYSRTNSSSKAFEEVDLNEIVAELILSLKDSIEEKLAVVEFKTLPKLKGIPFQFKQLFENLLLNSLKYARAGVPPRIVIGAEVVDGTEAGLKGTLSTKSFYKISVVDNGIGFEQQYAERIFELFQRLHGKHEFPGSGLGLSICKKVIENHNGYITANAEPGKGATFTILLPK